MFDAFVVWGRSNYQVRQAREFKARLLDWIEELDSVNHSERRILPLLINCLLRTGTLTTAALYIRHNLNSSHCEFNFIVM